MLQRAGKIAERPYHIKEINTDVNSLEEINYFVYNHINLVYRDFFCDELFDYIENELMQPALSGQLRVMEQAGADLKSLIGYLLRESYYYDAQMLSKISGLVMNIDNISQPERMKIEGDSLFRERKYAAAKAVYLKILNDPNETLKGEFYADVAFSAGLCMANLFLCKSACAYFNMAYDIFPKEDHVLACLYISIIMEDENELLKAIIKYRVSDETLEDIRKNIRALKRQVISSNAYKSRFDNMTPEKAKAMALDVKEEFYRMTE